MLLNRYKRRADLIPNLVSGGAGLRGARKKLLTRVARRAPVRRNQGDAGAVNDPAAFAKFQKAQGDWAGAGATAARLRKNTRSSRPTPNSATCRLSSRGTGEPDYRGAQPLYIKAVQGMQHLGADVSHN